MPTKPPPTKSPAKSHAQRRIRKQLGLPDPSAHSAVMGHGKRAANEREVIEKAAIETITFIEQQTTEMIVPDRPVTIAEISLSNTLYASKSVNNILRKHHLAPDTGDPVYDLKRDTMVGQLANATLRTLARVHEVYLRGQNNDRLAQILDSIKELDDEEC